jgi:hypothetical protein
LSHKKHRRGHYNDADELEVGNGELTLAEERSHFALWCLLKSPLIIGTDVQKLLPAALDILQNKRLIAVNQDPLAVQGTLRVAFDSNGSRAPTIKVKTVPCVTDPTPCAQGSPWVTHCIFGGEGGSATAGAAPMVAAAAAAQRWETVEVGGIGGQLISQPSTKKCLARLTAATAVSIVGCDVGNPRQAWDVGAATTTVAQVRDASNASSCLTFNGSSLHMESCHKEVGDKVTPNPSGCHDGNCRFSSIIYQLWYLNSLGQFTSAITNIENGADQLLPMIPTFPSNTPWCLASSPNPAGHSPAPPPAVDSTLPLQVWAGPLAGGDVVVLLLNTGNGTHPITADWADIGLKKSRLRVKATDLWTGKATGAPVAGSISAKVASHDCAVFRLSPS